MQNQVKESFSEFEDSIVLSCLRKGIEIKMKENYSLTKVCREYEDQEAVSKLLEERKVLEKYLQKIEMKKTFKPENRNIYKAV